MEKMKLIEAFSLSDARKMMQEGYFVLHVYNHQVQGLAATIQEVPVFIMQLAETEGRAIDPDMLEVRKRDLLDLVHWSRRYCSGRLTGAPSEFNQVYDTLKARYPQAMESEHSDAHVISTYPYAEEK